MHLWFISVTCPRVVSAFSKPLRDPLSHLRGSADTNLLFSQTGGLIHDWFGKKEAFQNEPTVTRFTCEIQDATDGENRKSNWEGERVKLAKIVGNI